jgi:ATP-dependent Lon protease
MTGEITLRGRVLPVGGVREKLLAAQRAGLSTVLLPKGCERELDEVPPGALDELELIVVETMDEVVEHALVPLRGSRRGRQAAGRRRAARSRGGRERS